MIELRSLFIGLPLLSKGASLNLEGGHYITPFVAGLFAGNIQSVRQMRASTGLDLDLQWMAFFRAICRGLYYPDINAEDVSSVVENWTIAFPGTTKDEVWRKLSETSSQLGYIDAHLSDDVPHGGRRSINFERFTPRLARVKVGGPWHYLRD